MDKKRILVVEDEGIVALDIGDSLEGLGYAVAGTAATGEEAVEMALAASPDLILMDIRLGEGMDGIDASLKIGESLDVPIIYLTAYSDERTLARAKLAGPFSYLVKPFSERELRTNIEMALYRHSVERELRTREQWLATTLRSIGDGVVATQGEGKVVFINPVAEKLTAWTEQEALNQDLSEVFLIEDPETGRRLGNPVETVLDTGKPIELSGTLRVRGRDGRHFPVEDSAAPIIGPKGEIDGVVLVFRDVTEKRAAEEALRISEEKLRQAQKMESLGRLAGGIAHDFNNLLSAINGYSELVLASLDEGDPLHGHVAEIRKSGDRAANLTQRLLAFSRKQAIHPMALDVNASVEAMAAILKRLIGSRVELVTRLESGLEKVRADPGQLEQVVMNLVLNARDAMPEGGTVTVGTRTLEWNGTAALAEDSDFTGLPGKYVVLSVADQGIGMDEATRARIFEPFFTTKEVGRGTGLGLSMVHSFVNQGGGHITVSSRPNQGSRFTLYLPAEGVGSEAAPGELRIS